MSKIEQILESPQELAKQLPVTTELQAVIAGHRKEICNIFDRKDRRLLMLIGPCSIHNPEAAMEYAARLQKLANRVSDDIKIVMRTYFEKPRTTLGWKGLIYDPDLNGEYNIAKGMELARKLLIDINSTGMPAATELLDPTTSSYLSELVSWVGIGARTSESPTHRQLASGLDMPVGFKNSTDGNLQIAIDAICAAAASHNFIGVLASGHTGIMRTSGNPYGHMVLRGGSSGENYYAASIASVVQKLAKADLRTNIVVDCSHGNSRKDPARQHIVLENILTQILSGEEHITGVMLESNILSGCQQLIPGKLPDPNISITDSCIGWEETENLVMAAATFLRHRRLARYNDIPTLPRQVSVAYLGPAATFSHIAAQKVFSGRDEYVPCGSIKAVFKAVESGVCDFGCVPVENSTEGIVNATLDTLVNSNLKIHREIAIPIHQCLLANVPAEEIKVIYSHAQSMGQCTEFLQEHFPDVETITVASNAKAAELASRTPGAAVIASIEAAQVYQLNVIARNIEDAENNITRFFILSRSENHKESCNKTCLCFTASEKVGALYDCLEPFKKHKISLSMIESRPAGTRNWQYIFFIDVLGTPDIPEVALALAELAQKADDLKIIASFPAK